MIELILFIAQVISGILLADFLSGVVHYIEDNTDLTGVKWFDDAIIKPNQLHHAEPMAMMDAGFWSRNGTTIAAASVVAFPLLLIFGPSTLLVSAWLAGSMGNQTHYWSHLSKPPKVVAWLQDRRILLSRKDHWSHHKPPHETSFCTITSLLNPIYNRFFVR